MNNGQLTEALASPTPIEASPSRVSPGEVMRRVNELLVSLGYTGLGVIAVSPKFGNTVNPLEFMPDGWRLAIVPVKNDNNSVLS